MSRHKNTFIRLSDSEIEEYINSIKKYEERVVKTATIKRVIKSVCPSFYTNEKTNENYRRFLWKLLIELNNSSEDELLNIRDFLMACEEPTYIYCTGIMKVEKKYDLDRYKQIIKRTISPELYTTYEQTKVISDSHADLCNSVLVSIIHGMLSILNKTGKLPCIFGSNCTRVSRSYHTSTHSHGGKIKKRKYSTRRHRRRV
jgi:hypothetical protein